MNTIPMYVGKTFVIEDLEDAHCIVKSWEENPYSPDRRLLAAIMLIREHSQRHIELAKDWRKQLIGGAFKRGDLVRKKGNKGQWHGRIVGEYSASCTEEGYAVESLLEKGSVQIYPVSALEPWDGKDGG